MQSWSARVSYSVCNEFLVLWFLTGNPLNNLSFFTTFGTCLFCFSVEQGKLTTGEIPLHDGEHLKWIHRIFMGGYLLITNVLLINLLIAIFRYYVLYFQLPSVNQRHWKVFFYWEACSFQFLMCFSFPVCNCAWKSVHKPCVSMTFPLTHKIFLENEVLTLSTWACQESWLSVITPRQVVELKNFTKPWPKCNGCQGSINCCFFIIIASV